jgi:hypothetical protein
MAPRSSRQRFGAMLARVTRANTGHGSPSPAAGLPFGKRHAIAPGCQHRLAIDGSRANRPPSEAAGSPDSRTRH